MVISIICQPDEALEDFERLDSGQVRGGDAFAEGSDTASIHSDTASIASHDVRLDPLQLRLKGTDMHVHDCTSVNFRIFPYSVYFSPDLPLDSQRV